MLSMRTMALALVLVAAGCASEPDGTPRIGEGTCVHDLCTMGAPVDSTCHDCAAAICAVDPFCCDVSWDGICVLEVDSVCGETCPADCGDGICGPGEDCGACPGDCGSCPSCGNGVCEWTEDCASCTSDCGACPTCSHDVCDEGEALAADCDTCTAAICAADPYCCTVSWDRLCVSEVASICGLPCGAGACGDGFVDPGEVCDDGNTIDGDGCSATCLSNEVCGNGIVDVVMGEECDDGNPINGDGCNSDCTIGGCGNGFIDPGEVCDDGNTIDGDGCSATCLSNETCGNGIVDVVMGEVCDDGNTIDGDGCSADCRSTDSLCGNGIVDPGEQCDAGGESATCDADCTIAFCGDGYVNTLLGEQCDAGGESATCDLDCTFVLCGDGACNGLAEDCAGCSADCCPTCAHDMCAEGGPLDAACDPCVAAICSTDTFCCTTIWDAICVTEVASTCGLTCP